MKKLNCITEHFFTSGSIQSPNYNMELKIFFQIRTKQRHKTIYFLYMNDKKIYQNNEFSFME